MPGNINSMGDDRDELESVVEYDQRVLNIAIQAAQDMLVTGETLKEVSFGWENGGNFWLSSDKAKIVNPHKIEVNGTYFYLGIFLR